MKRKGLIVFVIVFLVVLNLGTLTFIWLHQMPGQFSSERRDASGFLVKELMFTESQKSEYFQLRILHRRELEQLQRQDRALHKKFFDQLIVVSRDSLTTENLVDSIAIIRKEMELLTFNHFLKIRKILRPEQQKKFDSIFHDVLRMVLPPPPPPPPPLPASPPPPPPGK